MESGEKTVASVGRGDVKERGKKKSDKRRRSEDFQKLKETLSPQHVSG